MKPDYKVFLFLLILVCTVIFNCKKPYNPPAIALPGSYLVVEGNIALGADSTIFRLNRTVNISSGTTVNPETGAIVTVESSTGGSYPLTEITKGYYAAGGLNLDNSLQYRLRIQTVGRDQYLSDFVATKITPPIDSVGFSITSNAVNIYVNTHDPNNNTHYYRWEYGETWKFHSEYYSAYISTTTAIVPRTADQQVYNCYGRDSSSNILLGSSAQLKQDVIYQAPVLQIPSTSEKIEIEYSILLKQYALTSDAYNFYVNVKKNTEQLGSIFDALPSAAPTNLHDITNPSTPVVGYITASSVQSKRIFISNAQLPQTDAWLTVYPYECQLDSNIGPSVAYLIGNTSEIPVSAIYKPMEGLVGYLSSSRSCVDCTLRGTVTQPLFWK
ncbi:DUF4249 domain-containing protein [Mucilaginibacter sp. X4EP1]|uniref:DUF4249 domain-containing protein n=1 Tax=Mucilaginibacter sp. X4EP1 TaxID=2723092 RepID=UPI00216A8519|nr:DUF4249 domain-containing protein [Mucilaginibacter sp. X4EP1]MCS3812379.1 hypothetical protein [Mucilaginibacter sp. X4EP1]